MTNYIMKCLIDIQNMYCIYIYIYIFSEVSLSEVRWCLHKLQSLWCKGNCVLNVEHRNWNLSIDLITPVSINRLLITTLFLILSFLRSIRPPLYCTCLRRNVNTFSLMSVSVRADAIISAKLSMWCKKSELAVATISSATDKISTEYCM